MRNFGQSLSRAIGGLWWGTNLSSNIGVHRRRLGKLGQERSLSDRFRGSYGWKPSDIGLAEKAEPWRRPKKRQSKTPLERWRQNLQSGKSVSELRQAAEEAKAKHLFACIHPITVSLACGSQPCVYSSLLYTHDCLHM